MESAPKETLKRIRDHLIEKGMGDVASKMDADPLGLARGIMEYAHRNQKRQNGEGYANHPKRCLERYRRFLGIDPDGPWLVDEERLAKCGIPYKGVRELCLLHDVVEDSEFSLFDVEGIFVAQGFGDYFNRYVKDALKRITHDEAVPYEDYVQIVLGNPASAIVKIMDLQDNLGVLDLVELNDRTLDRAIGYLRYLHQVNEAYRFVESAVAYRKAMGSLE